MITNVLYILLALVLLSVIVVFHELGHYIAGRMTGIGVEEFAVGMGPKLFSFTRKGIKYSLRALPIGGFCRFVGEDEDNPAPNAMNAQAVWKRFVTIFSGPLLNFVLAFVAMTAFIAMYGLSVACPIITGTVDQSPAQMAGLQAGDKVIMIDGTAIPYDEGGLNQLIEMISGHQDGGPIDVTILRGDAELEFSITPRVSDSGKREIGIMLGGEHVRYGVFQAVGASGRQVVSVFAQMLEGLRDLIFRGVGADETMGPVGIVAFVAEETRGGGLQTVLMLTVLISMNLGIVNLLPLPALDGGRLIFLIIEGVRGKPIKPEYEGRVHAAGLLLLFAVIIFFSYRDIARLIGG